MKIADLLFVLVATGEPTNSNNTKTFTPITASMFARLLQASADLKRRKHN